jgi:hypothetical protein
MKQKAIVVEVAADGTTQVEGHNFAGADCVKATAFIETALGVKTGGKRKPEYTQRTVNQVKVQQ